MLMLTAVAVLQLVVSVALCCWIANQQRRLSGQSAKVRALEEVLGNFGQKPQEIDPFEDRFDQISAELARLREQAKQLEIASDVTSEQRKQPVKARNFSQFRSAAEEKFIA